jgi:hypothetical protein
MFKCCEAGAKRSRIILVEQYSELQRYSALVPTAPAPNLQ